MYPVYVIVETNLNPDIYSSEFFPADYIVYRCDRSALTSVKSSGGGVLMAIHSSIVSMAVDSDPTIELLCIKLNICMRCIYIIGLYIPPRSPSEVYTKYTNCLYNVISKLNVDDNVLVLGDFNLPKVKWLVDDDVNCVIPYNVTSDVESICIDSILSFGLVQINNVPNYNETFLDLFFANSANLFMIKLAPIPYIVNDVNHKSMEINLNISEFLLSNSNINNFNYIKFYNFRLADNDGLISYFNSVEWNSCFSLVDIDRDVQLFYDILFIGFDRFVPVSVKSVNRNNPPWFNKDLINLRNRKKKLYRRWKLSKNDDDRVAFLNFSKQFDGLHCIAYKNYITKAQNSMASNPKSFWNFVNSKRKTFGFPSSMCFNDVTANNSGDIANLFATFFQSIYSRTDIVNNKYDSVEGSSVSSSFYTPHISPDDIIKSLRFFKDGCGPDGISSYFLKQFSNEIALPLSILFNNSLSKGVFPVTWKSSHIVPIFKSGNRSEVSNYRGISLLSAIPKLFESIVCDYMFFGLKSLIVDEQHGFFRGRSTVSNLVEFAKRATEVIESNAQLDVIYTDFSKAFDSINHFIVLQKLKSFGINDNLINWLESYLTGRVQFVAINNNFSKPIYVHSGVPQGSHLGPLIFILFVNDITKCLKFSRCLIYADDLKIFSPIRNLSDAVKLQKDLDAVNFWCKINLLHLNVAKCKMVTFTHSSSHLIYNYNIANINLTRVNEIKDLGITFTSTLSFNRHFDLICAKANSMLGFLIRSMKEFNNPRVFVCLYQSLVRSQLEYASCVWSPRYSDHIKRIESVQKRFLIFYARKTGGFDRRLPWWENVRNLPSYVDSCKSLKIEPLEIRRQHAGAIFISDLLNGIILSSYLLMNIKLYAPTRNLRTRTLLKIDFHRTNYGSDEPLNSMSKVYNELSMFCDFNMTKLEIRKSLKKSYFSC